MFATTLLQELLVPGWQPDPVDPARERYFDGAVWTIEVRDRQGVDPVHHEARRVAPGWYADPEDETSLRYFDGLAWTGRLMPRPGYRPRGWKERRALRQLGRSR